MMKLKVNVPLTGASPITAVPLLMSENGGPPPDSAVLATICELAGKPPGTVMSHTV